MKGKEMNKLIDLGQIHALENKIMELADEIRHTGVGMSKETRNHWGTLDVNLNSLMRASRFLSEDIHQQMEKLDS